MDFGQLVLGDVEQAVALLPPVYVGLGLTVQGFRV